MSLSGLNVSARLVPANYLKLAQEAQKSKEVALRELIEKACDMDVCCFPNGSIIFATLSKQRKLPENGWPDDEIETVVRQLSALDSNNFSSRAGLGEREARIASRLVARRHYNFGHGIGRSGDLLEAQPKAAGSTLMANLTNDLLLDLIRMMGVRSCSSCFLVPMATGMTLTLCLLSMRKQRPKAHYVLFSRIDQKSCVKSMTSAGLDLVVVPPLQVNDENGSGLETDLVGFEKQLAALDPNEVLCIFSTASCFAPRNCDDLAGLAALAAVHQVPHLVNNAYGLQSTLLTHQIEQASRAGRVDLFVQSTDKNLMVPVGGAIVAGFDEATVRSVAKTYAGRGSSSQTLDVFMTLLSLGKSGYSGHVKQRTTNFEYLRHKLKDFANTHGETVYGTRNNPISLAMTLTALSPSAANLSQFGSMLYTRGVHGVRVVVPGETKAIDGNIFQDWGTHRRGTKRPYLTVAAALGVSQTEIDVFMRKLQNAWTAYKNINRNTTA